ncbi:hypothetical protein GCM10009759_29420 [Kitasatospora saccharophila]|uniref:Uncharacterized protein n=1 Tax=Kitasatospora saccharophila TaxID=407973 RepID=A0ABN2WT84_9ACTN
MDERRSTGCLAAVVLGLGLLLVLAAGVAAALSGSRRAWVAVLVVALPLLLLGVWRATALAPMLECGGGWIERAGNGSYRCYG